MTLQAGDKVWVKARVVTTGLPDQVHPITVVIGEDEQGPVIAVKHVYGKDVELEREKP